MESGDPETSAGPARAEPPAADATGSRDEESWLDILPSAFPRAIRERYQLRRLLGEGGMGVVLEAMDTQLGRVVAIKGARDPRGVTAERRRRLAREAHLHARLTHPNILPVYDSWTDVHGNPWCSMMRVEGASATTLATRLGLLAEVTDVSERPLGELLQTFLQICRAVSHAHGSGIVHRDLKPENVLLGPSGEALVADWGLARTLDDDSSAGEVVGTAGYAAPEQLGALGAPRSGARSDVFSLGVILRDVVAGPAAPTLPSRIPRDLSHIIDRATNREEARRFASADELRVAVEAYLAGGLVEGMRYTAGELLTRWIRARPRLSTALAIGAVFASVVAVMYTRSAEEVRRRYHDAQRSLAVSHVARALERQADQPDAARLHAALAFQAAASVPGHELPGGPVQSLFTSRSTHGPLAWTCRLEAPVADLSFDVRGSSFSVITTAPSLFTWQLPDTRVWSRAALPGGPVWNATVHRGAELAATGTLTGDVLLHRAGTGRPPLRLGGPDERIAGLALGPDGAVIATGLRSPVASLWSTRTGQLERRLAGHRSEIWAMRFDPTGTRLVTAGRNGDISVWHAARGQLQRVLENTGGAALALAFSPDGTRLATAGAGRVQIRELANGGLVRTLGGDLGIVTALDWSPDGRWIASGGQDATVRIWPATGERDRVRLVGHRSRIVRVAFDPDASRLASASVDGTVCLWDVPRAVETGDVPRGGRIRSIACAAGDRVVAASDDGRLTVWDAATGRTLARHVAGDAAGSRTAAVRAVALSAGDVPVLAICSSERLERWSPGAGAVALGACGTGSIAIDPDGQRIAVAAGDVVSLIAAASTVRLPAGPVRCLAFASDGRRLVTAGRGSPIRVWDAASGRLEREVAPPAADVSCVALAANAPVLISGAEDATVRVHDLAGGPPRVLGTQASWIAHVAVSPAGDVALGAGADGMRAWHVPTGRLLSLFAIDGQPVSGVAFSPDGRFFACAAGAQPRIVAMKAYSDPAAHISDLIGESFYALSPLDGSLVPRSPREAPRAR